MRLLTFTLLILLSFASCTGAVRSVEQQDDGAFLCDTIEVHLRGRLRAAVRYDERYYCIWEKGNSPYGSSRELVVFSPAGILEARLPVPLPMETPYFDLHVRSDSVLVKLYMDGGTYYLQPDLLRWERIEDVDDLIYEDEQYRVYYIGYGEWGGTVWFHDKATGHQYEISAGENPEITHYQGRYYMTFFYGIFEIADPALMELCEPSACYHQVRNNQHGEGSSSLQGRRLIYGDSIGYNFEDREVVLYTSFVSDGRLLHLFRNDEGVYTGTLEQGRLQPLEQIGEDLRANHSYYNYRYRNQGNYRFRVFSTDDPSLFAFFETDGRRMSLTRLHNTWREPRISEQMGDSLFHERLAQVIRRPRDFSLPQIEAWEEAGNRAVVVSERSEKMMQHRWNLLKEEGAGTDEVVFTRIYRYFLDSLFLMDVLYGYDFETRQVTGTSWIWMESNRQDVFDPDDTAFRRRLWDTRFEHLTAAVEKATGVPGKKSDHRLYWETGNGFAIRLQNENTGRYPRYRIWLSLEEL